MNSLRMGIAAAALAGIAALAVPQGAAAQCHATVNGQPMSARLCQLATLVYGAVTPGHYWMDNQGNWGIAGSPFVQGNLFADAQRAQAQAGGAAGYTRRGPFGTTGSDGNCHYYNDPTTGASVMTGTC